MVDVAVAPSLRVAELGLGVTALAGVVDASATTSLRPELAEAVAGCQGLINMLTAVQDVAIAGVAAIEEEWAEDGLVVESRRVLGHVALDAPDVVAGALCVSHLQAQRRVSLAARLAAAGVGDDGEGAGQEGPEDEGAEAEDAAGAEAAEAAVLSPPTRRMRMPMLRR